MFDGNWSFFCSSIHGSVDHPCILRRFDVYHEKSDLFVEMEYAAGGSLFDRIHKTYIMDEDECKFIFYQIGCALAYLHRLKIVRRVFFRRKICERLEKLRFIEISNPPMFFSCRVKEKQ